jgi:hypothetical protein
VSALNLARLGTVATVIAVSNCARPPSEQECLELLGHYAELLSQTNRPEAPNEEVERIKSQARARALRADPGLVDCRRKVSRSALSCALLAPTVDEIERCLLQ